MEVLNSKRIDRRANISLVESSNINLSLFDLEQIIMGADLYFSECFKKKGRVLLDINYKVYTRLTVNFHLINTLPLDDQAHGIDFEFNRISIEIILNWLSVRIDHCTAEKEAKLEKFNPLTYVQQRELRLEIKELLQVAIIED